jgi:hypothetical protein
MQQVFQGYGVAAVYEGQVRTQPLRHSLNAHKHGVRLRLSGSRSGVGPTFCPADQVQGPWRMLMVLSCETQELPTSTTTRGKAPTTPNL